ncbi:Secretory immunoglobulin A-binding protein EsiB [Vanrija pseudolonga]|uniref:Secretory immunoglobulin A-binding protein EsiB n=1 Tax=Vanrija pseudolonga TaxID=143232 RepID=A0AAF0YCT3_9TREE|nr:Secretory immunoglobulin A-binding protein EsiB [Vanrija pseudolonga]
MALKNIFKLKRNRSSDGNEARNGNGSGAAGWSAPLPPWPRPSGSPPMLQHESKYNCLEIAQMVLADPQAPGYICYMAANELLRANFMQDLILMQLGGMGVDVYPREAVFGVVFELGVRARQGGCTKGYIIISHMLASPNYFAPVHEGSFAHAAHMLHYVIDTDTEAAIRFIDHARLATPTEGIDAAQIAEWKATAARKLDELLASPGGADRDWNNALQTKGLHNLRVLKAYMLFTGDGYPQDLAASRKLFEEAEARGDHEAGMELYIFESVGHGCPVNNDKAIAYLRRAAANGSQRAMCNLGGFHATGNGVPKDEKLGVEWYAKAAELGNYRGNRTLAMMHGTGQGAPLDAEKAEEYEFEAAVAGWPHPLNINDLMDVPVDQVKIPQYS